jgi:lysozyme family protein
MTYERALKFTLGIEGDLSDNTADRGGRTMHGVTQKAYDAWRLKKDLPSVDVAGITSAEILALYKDMFWDVAGCDLLPEKLGMCLFDVAVNSGPAAAIKMMQRLLGLDDDGVLGPKTRAAFSAAIDSNDAVMNFTDARLDFYCDIVKQTYTQAIFIKGWIRRVRQLERKLIEG